QGGCKIAKGQFTGDETPVGDTAEALVVEVIWHTHSGDFGQSLHGPFDLGGRQTSHRDRKPVRPEVLRPVRDRYAAQVTNVKCSVRQVPLGSVVDGEVLDGVGMAIL